MEFNVKDIRTKLQHPVIPSASSSASLCSFDSQLSKVNVNKKSYQEYDKEDVDAKEKLLTCDKVNVTKTDDHTDTLSLNYNKSSFIENKSGKYTIFI